MHATTGYAAAHATYASPTSMDAAASAPVTSSATATEASVQDVDTPITEVVGAAEATPGTGVTTPLSAEEAEMADAAALPNHAATRLNVPIGMSGDIARHR